MLENKANYLSEEELRKQAERDRIDRNNSFSDNLNHCRTWHKRYSQRVLGEMIGVSESFIQKHEKRGQRYKHLPPFDVIIDIVVACNYPLGLLVPKKYRDKVIAAEEEYESIYRYKDERPYPRVNRTAAQAEALDTVVHRKEPGEAEAVREYLALLGHQVKKARIKKGRTQEELAMFVNCSPRLLRDLENGKRSKFPPLGILLNLGRYLELEHSTLFPSYACADLQCLFFEPECLPNNDEVNFDDCILSDEDLRILGINDINDIPDFTLD